MRYCGRDFASADIHGIRQIIEAHPTATRARLSRLVCEQLDWRRDDGRLKDMSCRVAMLRMQDDRVLHLPPPRNGNNNGKPYRRRTRQAEPAALLEAASPTALGALHLQVVTDRHDSHLHNELIDRYHYLGYQPLPGAQLRYFVRANRRIVALLGFGAAAWKTQPRDLFIGWTPEQRQQRLHLVTNNARFLILPWVRCKNLAVRHPGDGRSTAPTGLEPALWLQPSLARDLRRAPPVPWNLLPSGKLEPLGHDQGPGKARPLQPGIAAEEGCLGLPTRQELPACSLRRMSPRSAAHCDITRPSSPSSARRGRTLCPDLLRSSEPRTCP